MNHLPWVFTTPQSLIVPSQLKLPPPIPIQAERAPRLKIPHFPLRRFTPPLPLPQKNAQVEGEGEGTQPHILRILELVEQRSQAISKHQGRLDQFIDSTTSRLDQLEESVKAGLQVQVQVPNQAQTASRSEEPTESLSKDCEEGLRHFKEMFADLDPPDSDPDTTDSTLIDQLEVEPFIDYKNQQARTLLALSRFSSLNEGTSSYVNDGSGGGGTIDPKIIQSSFQSNDSSQGVSPTVSMMMPGPPDPLSSLRVSPEHSPDPESITDSGENLKGQANDISMDLRQVSAELSSLVVANDLQAKTTEAPAVPSIPLSPSQSTETSPLESTYSPSSATFPESPLIDTQLSTSTTNPPRPPKRPPPTLPQRSYRRRTEPVRLDPSPAQQSETGTSMKKSKLKGLVRRGSTVPGKKKRSLGPKGSLPLGTLGKSDGSRRVKMADWPKVGPNSVIGLGGDIQCEQCGGHVHRACAGLRDDEVIPDMAWICPDCDYVRMNSCPPLSAVADETTCIRYNCIRRRNERIVRKPGDTELYVIERAIGRRAVLPERRHITKGRYEYLTKWSGYRLDESTWEPEESFVALGEMARQFVETAVLEGWDVGVVGDTSILLDEAKGTFGLDGLLKV